MKRLVLVALLTLSLAATAEAKDTYTFKDRKITVAPSEKYLEVVTEHATYRIYPCGQVEKLVWKELNPNEDSAPIGAYYTYSGTVLTPVTNTPAIGTLAH